MSFARNASCIIERAKAIAVTRGEDELSFTSLVTVLAHDSEAGDHLAQSACRFAPKRFGRSIRCQATSSGCVPAPRTGPGRSAPRSPSQRAASKSPI